MNNIPPAKWLAVWFVCAILFLIVAKCHALTPSEREIVAQAQAKIVDLRAQLDLAQTANDSALTGLTLATVQISELSAAANKAAEQAAILTAERDSIKDALAVAKADKAKLLANFHKFKLTTALAVSSLVTLLAGLLIFRFMAPALNTVPGCALAFGAPAALGFATFIAIITR